MNYEEELSEFKKKTLIFCRGALYPLTICYTYFVIIGILVLTEKNFSTAFALVYFLFFHVILMYTVVFYIRIFPTEGVTTKDFFYPEAGENITTDFMNMFIADNIKVNIITRKNMCSICKVFKPPRAHHCRRCNVCYLKMDHHCVFLNECIAWHNYKFFVLFLFFNTILSIYVVGTLLYELVFVDMRTNYFVHYIICASIFGVELLLSGVLLGYHSYLIWHNESTLENLAINNYLDNVYDPKTKNVFQEGMLASAREGSDIGLKERDRQVLNPYNTTPFENFKSVFGQKPKQWFLPTFSSVGNGIHFDKNIKSEEEEFEVF